MPERSRTMPNPPEPRRGLPPNPETFEAVDRLIAMATEKRSDRAPVSALALPPDRAIPEVPAPPASPAAPRAAAGAAHTAGRVLSAIRPMLPAVTAALRMVDHGAVQAAARLLPLLAGLGTPASTSEATKSQALLEAGLREHRKELDEFRSELIAVEERLTELRWKGAQVESEQTIQALGLAKLNKRVRLLTIAVVFLLPLVIALVVLLFMTLHA